MSNIVCSCFVSSSVAGRKCVLSHKGHDLDHLLDSAQLAVRRVKLRVSLGGHDVPADVVRRRFARSQTNFFALYAPLADDWALFDNSQAGDARLIAELRNQHLQIEDVPSWTRLQPKNRPPT